MLGLQGSVADRNGYLYAMHQTIRTSISTSRKHIPLKISRLYACIHPSIIHHPSPIHPLSQQLIYPPIHLPTQTLIYHLPTPLPTHPSTQLPIYSKLFIHPPIYPFIYLFTHPPTHPSTPNCQNCPSIPSHLFTGPIYTAGSMF